MATIAQRALAQMKAKEAKREESRRIKDVGAYGTRAILARQYENKTMTERGYISTGEYYVQKDVVLFARQRGMPVDQVLSDLESAPRAQSRLIGRKLSFNPQGESEYQRSLSVLREKVAISQGERPNYEGKNQIVHYGGVMQTKHGPISTPYTFTEEESGSLDYRQMKPVKTYSEDEFKTSSILNEPSPIKATRPRMQWSWEEAGKSTITTAYGAGGLTLAATANPLLAAGMTGLGAVAGAGGYTAAWAREQIVPEVSPLPKLPDLPGGGFEIAGFKIRSGEDLGWPGWYYSEIRKFTGRQDEGLGVSWPTIQTPKEIAGTQVGTQQIPYTWGPLGSGEITRTQATGFGASALILGAGSRAVFGSTGKPTKISSEVISRSFLKQTAEKSIPTYDFIKGKVVKGKTATAAGAAEYDILLGVGGKGGTALYRGRGVSALKIMGSDVDAISATRLLKVYESAPKATKWGPLNPAIDWYRSKLTYYPETLDVKGLSSSRELIRIVKEDPARVVQINKVLSVGETRMGREVSGGLIKTTSRELFSAPKVRADTFMGGGWMKTAKGRGIDVLEGGMAKITTIQEAAPSKTWGKWFQAPKTPAGPIYSGKAAAAILETPKPISINQAIGRGMVEAVGELRPARATPYYYASAMWEDLGEEQLLRPGQALGFSQTPKQSQELFAAQTSKQRLNQLNKMMGPGLFSGLGQPRQDLTGFGLGFRMNTRQAALTRMGQDFMPKLDQSFWPRIDQTTWPKMTTQKIIGGFTPPMPPSAPGMPGIPVMPPFVFGGMRQRRGRAFDLFGMWKRGVKRKWVDEEDYLQALFGRRRKKKRRGWKGRVFRGYQK